MIALDTETHLITPTDKAPRLVCYSIADEGGARVERGLPALDQLATGIVGINIAYDLAVLIRAGLDPTFVWQLYADGLVRDLSIDARLHGIAAGERGGHYSMSALAARYLDETVLKADTWRMHYAELDDVPLALWPADAVEYSRHDAEITWRLHKTIPMHARSADEARAAWALHLASVWGIAVDQAQVEVMRAQLVVEQGDAEQRAGALIVSGKRSMAAIRAAVSAELSSPPLTAKGAVSTSADTIALCKAPELQAVAEYVTAQKHLSTYLGPLVGAETIHPRFSVLAAESGRTGSSEPNIQNQPRAEGFRECYVPRPDRLFVAVDYSAQEMRTLAQVCQDITGASRLAEEFRKDPHFDPHTLFAKQMIGERWDDMTAAEHKAFRQRAKAANFGFPGGMGTKTFRKYAEGYGLDLDERAAATLRDAWFAAWPEMRAYFAHIADVTKGDWGTITIPRTNFVRGGLYYSNAANAYFQGLAACCSKRALWHASEACYSTDGPLADSRIVAFVHDEIIIETPEEHALDAARALAQIMIDAQEYYTPDVPAAVGASIMSRWQKGAEEIEL